MATTKTRVREFNCPECKHIWTVPYNEDGSTFQLENECPKCARKNVVGTKTRYTAEPSELRIDVMAKRVWVQSLKAPIGSDDGIWVYDCEDEIESHCPMDRCGGPYGLSDFINDDCGERFFIFCVADCAFPIYDLVCADSWEDAHEAYIDFACDHRHIAIDDTDLKDYLDSDTGEYTGDYTSDGKHVDTEAIQGDEVRLIRIDV